MRKLSAVLLFLSLASLASAQRIDELNGKHTQLYPTKDKADKDAGDGKAKPGGGGSNLTNHGGPVLTQAKVVSIFWGSEWGTDTHPSALASTIMGFFAQFGTTPEYNVITQYSGIQQANLGSGTPDWFDASTPPTNVTDAIVQARSTTTFRPIPSTPARFTRSSSRAPRIPRTAPRPPAADRTSCTAPTTAPTPVAPTT